eukprot:gb/GECG01005513.1/.p1 GENE.gb/GECG01005513.1/~~gb/GECG01005513.1/.p1  ORF type:complete len:1012 (+),score=102.88 gb/GECG01005513.1/:1-3036(+)
MTETKREGCCQYFAAFFITVATILGTGILGLPVDLANAGFFPFIATFAMCLAMQLAVVWLMTDLLQRAHIELMQARLLRLFEDHEEEEEQGRTPKNGIRRRSLDSETIKVGRTERRRRYSDDPKETSSTVSEAETDTPPSASSPGQQQGPGEGGAAAASARAMATVSDYDHYSGKQRGASSKKKASRKVGVGGAKHSAESATQDPHVESLLEFKERTLVSEETTPLHGQDIDIYQSEEASSEAATLSRGKSDQEAEVDRVLREKIEQHYTNLIRETGEVTTETMERWTELAAFELRDSAVRPNLHSMGKMYLGVQLQRVFDAAVMLHFVSVLISYVLAGSQSYQEFIGIQFEIIILLFCIVYTFFIVVGERVIKPVISVVTTVKCSLLILMIGIVGFVSLQVNISPWNKWSKIMEPFLLGTVALGGVVNILPVVYSNVPLRKSSISKFRFAVSAGVTTCWVLNIMWAFFVLKIVPQTVEEEGEVSLENSKRNGEISTAPVIDVIDQDYEKYHWVSNLVTSFIILSVSVSYLTLGTGMKHVLDGYVDQRFERLDEERREERTNGTEIAETFNGVNDRENVFAKETNIGRNTAQKEDADGNRLCLRFCEQLMRLFRYLFMFLVTLLRKGCASLKAPAMKISLYTFWFGVILVIAISNPQGFLVVLEVFTSLALNVESGFFIGLMWYSARKRSLKQPSLSYHEDAGSKRRNPPRLQEAVHFMKSPNLLSDTFGHSSMILTIITFLFAVVYDIGEALSRLIHPEMTTWVLSAIGCLTIINVALPQTEALGYYWHFYYGLPVPLTFPKDFGFGDNAALTLQKQPCELGSRMAASIWRAFASRWRRELWWPSVTVVFAFASLLVSTPTGGNFSWSRDRLTYIILTLGGIVFLLFGQVLRGRYLLRRPVLSRHDTHSEHTHLNSNWHLNRTAFRVSCILSALCPGCLACACGFMYRYSEWESLGLLVVTLPGTTFTILAHLAQRSVLVSFLYRTQLGEASSQDVSKLRNLERDKLITG